MNRKRRVLLNERQYRQFRRFLKSKQRVNENSQNVRIDVNFNRRDLRNYSSNYILFDVSLTKNGRNRDSHFDLFLKVEFYFDSEYLDFTNASVYTESGMIKRKIRELELLKVFDEYGISRDTFQKMVSKCNRVFIEEGRHLERGSRYLTDGINDYEYFGS